MLKRHTIPLAVRHRTRTTLLGIGALLVASCSEPSRPTAPPKTETGEPHFTMGQGSTPTFIGQGTYTDFDMAKRITHDWHVELKAHGGLEVLVRSFSYNVGAYTGWHKHPGPVLIQVIEGAVTFFEADDPCTPIVVTAGHGYVDGGNGHIGRNLSGAPAKDVTIYFAPPGTQVSQLRIDMDAPPGAAACP
jgi:quercetin dioxygenase-like cupin family protein